MRGIRMFIFIFLVGTGGISCSENMGETGLDAENVTVRLVVSRPYPEGYSRSGETINLENEIREIQLLVFEEGKYAYRVPGISIMNTGAITTFTARLLASGKMLDLLIIANATAGVLSNEPDAGASVDDVRKTLQMAFAAGAPLSPLPMSGSYRLAGGLNADRVEEISGVKMLRAIARADVLVGTVPDFELTSVQAFRANNRIQMIPDQQVVTVTIPSVPANSRADVNTEQLAVSGGQSLGQLYLPESVSPAEADKVTAATCIVVGGKFGGSEENTYYRIDFDPDNAQNSFGQILRNHRYIFTIRSVAGPGWQTPEEAANNRSAQINVEIKAWDEATEDMNFDTEHHFGLSSREVILASRQNDTAIIRVNTDIPDYTLQWSDEQGNVSGTAAEILVNPYFRVEKAQDGSALVVTALQDNTNSEKEMTGYFVITANRWRILMSVRQLFGKPSVKTVTLLSFRNSLGHFGANLLLPLTNAEGRGRGTRGILDNPDNFGIAGTVVCGGFNLVLLDASKNTLTDAVLAVTDIVYFNYVGNGYIGDQDVSSVRRWLEGSSNRVLIVSCDAAGVNVPVLTEFLGGTEYLDWKAPVTGSYPLVNKSPENFFTDAGPFTVAPYTPVSEGFSFQNYDATHGEIVAGNNAGILPVLNGPGGGIVLGIDETHRIIYLGDVDINTSSNGTGATSTNHITNTTGEISNDAAKLIANVFAWAVGVVLKE